MRASSGRNRLLLLGLALASGCVLAGQRTRAEDDQTRASAAVIESCIAGASNYHRVNSQILRAILTVESSLRPGAVNRNANGTVDVGIGQINSTHFAELAKYNIAPAHLLNGCVGTYVSAWHLAKQLRAYGNTWFAVGAYHSATPYFNRRYQVLVHNALVRSGGLASSLLPVPPMKVAQAGSEAVARQPSGRSGTRREMVLIDSSPILTSGESESHKGPNSIRLESP